MIARGGSFLTRVIDGYELPVDAAFVEHTVYFARVRALGWLADAVRRGPNIETDMALVHRTFEST